MYKIVIFLLCVVIFVVLFINCCSTNVEGFDQMIRMYVISLRHEDRMKNIKIQEEKIKNNIIIFDAVKGDQLNIQQLLNDGIIDKTFENASKKEKRVIGCYMSHLHLLKQINNEMDGDNAVGYSIIFEDDFVIPIDHFLYETHTIITKLNSKKIDFDFIFLGNCSNNVGENMFDNVYKVNPQQNLYGTHGYIVNNKKINKILDKIKFIDSPIDNKYESLARENELTIFVIHPNIVHYAGDELPSNINDLSIENFSLNYSVI